MIKKRIAIDMRYTEKRNSGLTRFSKNIILNTLEQDISKEYFFYIILPPKKLSNHLEEVVEKSNKKVNIIFWDKKRKWRWKLGLYYFDLRLFLFLLEKKVDLFYTPYIDPPILFGIDIISTIHDITFIKVKKYFNKFNLIKKIFGEIRLIFTIIISKQIVSVSQSTKNDLIMRYKYLPKKFFKKIQNINIIHNGITKFKSKINNFDFEFKNYFLYVGDRRPHKNLKYLIELVKEIRFTLKKDIKLLIAGSKSYKNESLSKVIERNKDFVFEKISPTDSELKFLYMNCKSLFLLSKSEGFGIPVIEAESLGIKVVISNIPSLKEVASKNCLAIDCNSIEKNAFEVISFLNSDSSPNVKSIINKWSWKKSSIKLLKEFAVS